MEKKWIELSPDEKRQEMFKSWLSPQDVTFVSPEAEQSYKDRVTRIIDAIQLKVPDRVPVCPGVGFFPAYYSGITPEVAMYDYDKVCQAWKKYVLDFEPDSHEGASLAGPGKAYEILDYKLYRWPGHGTSPETPYQCVEAEYMKVDEYEALIDDPSDFWIRTYLPRICGALTPLAKLGMVTDVVEMPFTGHYLAHYGLPEVRAAFEAFLKAGQEALKWLTAVGACDVAAMAAGFPILYSSATKAPFDTLGDTLRGTHSIMLDMYQRPDKLFAAMERITPLMVKMGISGARASGNPVVFIPLHKGADGFMSDEQYRTFYWPSLQKVILGLIDEGMVPFVFAEGTYGSRLEIIKDLPKGKTIWAFDSTGMAKVKETLGDTACIAGNVPTSLLCTSTPAKIKDYCQNLIDVAGKGGGFILANGAALDAAKPENVHAMIETAKEYGVYQ